MATEPTQSAVDDPEMLRHLVAAAMWQRFAEYPQMNANEYARIACKVVWESGWRPARLVDLMLETPDDYPSQFDGRDDA